MKARIGVDVHRLNRLARIDVGLAALVFTVGLALYVRTLAPGLVWGDGAEFQTLAATLGMTHATGYPVYLLLGKLFTWLPAGDVAYRVNLLSAVGGATTLGTLYLLGRVLGGWRIAALVGPLVLGVSELFWWHAVMAELYTLAAAMLAGLLLLLALWRATANWRYLFAAGLAGGLSLGVHNTVALAAPAVLVYLLCTTRRRVDWGAAVAGAAAGTALALAAFLYIDTLDAPSGYYNTTMRYSWSVWFSSPSGLDSPWKRLAFLYGARQFQWGMFRAPRDVIPTNWARYREFFSMDWAPVAMGLMALGLVASLARRRTRYRAGLPEALLLLLTWLGMLGFVLNYEIGDIFAFFIPTYVVLAVVVSVGAAAVLDAVAALLRRSPLGPQARLAPGMLGVLLLAAAVQPAGADVRGSWRAGRITFLDDTDYEYYPYPVREPDSAHSVASRVVTQVGPDAIVFTDWGLVYAVYYVAHVERGQTGIAVHEWFVQDGVPGVAASLKEYIDANLGQRPIFFNEIPYDMPARYEFEQVDYDVPLYRIVRRRDQ